MRNTLIRGLLSCLLVLALQAAQAQHRHHRHYEFIPNQGQENASVKYAVRLKGGKLFVEDRSLLYHLQDNSDITAQHLGKNITDAKIKGHVYRMKWVNAQVPAYNTTAPTPHYYNFFLGNDQSRWKGGIHAFEKLSLGGLYPGITVKFETNTDERLEYSYFVAPGASPLQIMQQYENADRVAVAKNGDLLIGTHVGDIRELKPVAWQIINGKKTDVPCRYKVSQNTVTYDLYKGYDSRYELVIDPVLVFGSYSGSTADNFGMTATYDDEGHLYAGGTAFNTGYPTTAGAYDITANPTLGGAGAGYGITDVVLTKYAPDGTSLIYSTYLGGGTSTTGTETVHSLIVNSNNELMCFGATSSTDFPTTAGAFQTTHAGGSTIQFYFNGVYFQPSGTDIYVTKFNATGTGLIGSTYVGGSANDGVNYKVSSGTYSSPAAYDSLTSNYGDQFRGEIMIDNSNNIYITSTTRSTDFPVTPGAYQTSLSGSQDAVVFKFNPTLTAMLFSTYLGGTDKDAGYSLKLDAAGNIFATGGTSSADFPATSGSLHSTYQGGKTDGFITKLSPSGSAVLASSFIGTNVYDQSIFVEIDKNDMVYLYGNTLGTSVFPIVNVSYSNPNSGQFIMRLDNNLTTLDFSTLFGNGSGTTNISPSAFLVDVCGNIYISGWGANILGSTPLTGMPVTADAFQGTPGDGFNFYIACFQRNMSGLLYASYFGGSLSHEHVDGGTSRFDKYGIIYQSVCAGCGNHDDFPTTPGAWSNTNNSTNCNNGVFKFDFEITPVADFVTDFFQGCSPLTITFINSSPPDLDYLWDFGNGDTTSVIFNPVVTYTDTGSYIVTLVTEDSICGLIDTAVKVITVYPHLEVSAGPDSIICTGTIMDLVANGNGTSNSFVWSSSPVFGDTLNAPLSDSTLNVNITSDTVFYVQTFNPYCSTTDTLEIDLQQLDPVITSAVTSCAGDSAVLTAVNAVPGETYTIDWSPNAEILSGDGTPSILVSPSDTVLYTVTFTGSHCTGTNDYELFLLPGGIASVSAHADEDTIVAGGATGLHVVPSTGFTYTWSPSSGLSDPTSPNPIATPAATTTYVVSIASGGCVRTDTVRVVVMDFVCGDPYIFVPNAFTPNGDGKNDVLYVRGHNITEAYFAVYERWGEKVFETRDLNFGWDGKVNGREADPAVFDYYLEVTCAGGQNHFQKGNITLIR